MASGAPTCVRSRRGTAMSVTYPWPRGEYVRKAAAPKNVNRWRGINDDVSPCACVCTFRSSGGILTRLVAVSFSPPIRGERVPPEIFLRDDRALGVEVLPNYSQNDGVGSP